MGLFKRDLRTDQNPTRKGFRVMRTWARKGILFNTNFKNCMCLRESEDVIACFITTIFI